MSHVPHSLNEHFPYAAEQIHALRLNDPHFARLGGVYETINRSIHRAETDVEPTGDMHVIQMRKQRLHLLDEIAAYLV